MERQIQKGEIFLHFKGNKYIVEGIAMHTETEESLVIYRRLDGKELFARPYDMFNSLVDKEKYPEVLQKYRFEKI